MSEKFRVLVDADGCPVTKIVARVAKEHGIEAYFYCDTNHELNVNYGQVVRIAPGRDAVDFAMISALKKGDIVITQDYGVAAMALGKQASALHQNGKEYTSENIDQMLFERHMLKKERRSGKRINGKGPKKRTAEMDLQFEKQLRRVIKSKLNVNTLCKADE